MGKMMKDGDKKGLRELEKKHKKKKLVLRGKGKGNGGDKKNLMSFLKDDDEKELEDAMKEWEMADDKKKGEMEKEAMKAMKNDHVSEEDAKRAMKMMKW